MFRIIISVAFVIITAALGFAFHEVIDGQKEPVTTQLKERVVESHKGYELLASLRQLQMERIVTELTHSDVAAYLSVVDENRGSFYDLEVLVNQTFPAPASELLENETLLKKRRDYIDDSPACVLNTGKGEEIDETQCTDFVDDVADGITTRVGVIRGDDAWAKQSMEDFREDTRNAILDCAKIYAVSSCFYLMTSEPLKRLVNDIRANPDGYGVNPDLVVLTDKRGAGLANPDKPNWSEIVAKDKLFADGHPVVRRTKDSGIVQDVLQIDGAGDYYFVSAAPILDGKTYRGAVMVGVAIDEILLAEESQVMGWQVSYLDGRKLISSSLAEEQRQELLFNLPPRRETPEVFFSATDNLDANFLPLTGNTFNHDVQVVLSANRTAALASLTTVNTFLPLFVAVLILVGILCFVILFRYNLGPLVQIDTGIHEIMNGNHDYEFPSDYSDKLWSSMAKSLNRMVGILRDVSLEDDELEAYLGVVTRETAAVEVPEDFVEGGGSAGGDDEDQAAAG